MLKVDIEGAEYNFIPCLAQSSATACHKNPADAVYESFQSFPTPAWPCSGELAEIAKVRQASWTGCTWKSTGGSLPSLLLCWHLHVASMLFFVTASRLRGGRPVSNKALQGDGQSCPGRSQEAAGEQESGHPELLLRDLSSLPPCPHHRAPRERPALGRGCYSL